MRKWIAPSLLGLLTVAVFAQLPSAIAQRTDGYEFIDPVLDVRRILNERFVEDVDEVELRDAALRAMVNALEDPHTFYVPPVYEEQFNKSLRGTYVGIGAQVNIVDEYLTIVTPMEASPALKAGLRAGDVVLTIEGESTFQKPVNECIELLQGEPGTIVNVRVRHSDGTEADIAITRGHIVTKTVEGIRRNGTDWQHCIDHELGIQYVRLTQFNQESFQDLHDTLDGLRDDALNGLILDLRDNPGGSLPAAVQISDMFLSSGTIVSVRGRHAEEDRSWEAQGAGTLPGFAMVVLVNQRSASASEIVSGALQANGRARVLGSRTFGKGSVQEVHELPFERGTLKCTTAYYYLADGRTIHRRGDAPQWGVDPDPGMVLPLDDELYVEMLQRRRPFEAIANEDPAMSACVDDTWVRDTLGDAQLAAALDSMAAFLSDGQWIDVGDADPMDVAVRTELDAAIDQRTRLLEALDENEQAIASLQGMADAAGVDDDLLPDDANVEDGVIEIRDRLGNVIATFRLEGGDLELALQTMELTPIK